MTRFLVICLLLAGLSGCGTTCPPESEIPEKIPFYVNNSGVALNLILVQNEYIGDSSGYYEFTETRRKQKINNNDTLCNSYLEGMSCSWGRSAWSIATYEGSCDFIDLSRDGCEEPAYFKIEFLNEPKTCLVFDKDTVDNDIRYWENYILVKETPLRHDYYYYITEEHRAMAKEEYCQSSADE